MPCCLNVVWRPLQAYAHRMPNDDDFTAAAAQPHCPNCGTVLHWSKVAYRCTNCDLDVLPTT